MNQIMQVDQQRMLAPQANVGAVAIEQERAIAEAQGQLVLAKRFPRDVNAAYAELMSACKIPGLASVAFYNVPRAGGTVSGPSIRLAEEVARCYGNFEYGHRELSRDAEKSEVEVYAWDKEKNNYSKRQLTVMHVRDTRQGQVKLRDQKDIDDKIANVASKQVRGRILALLPKWMVEDAIQTCRATLAGNSQEPIEARVRKMTQAFAVFGVTVKMIEDHVGHSLSSVTADELVDLIGIYNSVKDGGIKPSEFFGGADHEPAPASQGIAAINQAAAQVAANENKEPVTKSRKKAEPAKAEPDPEPVVKDEAAPDAHQHPAADADEPDPFGDL